MLVCKILLLFVLSVLNIYPADILFTDVAYIGVIHPEHLRSAEIMMLHGKHILCEKPLSVNYSQSCKMVKVSINNYEN